MKKLTTEEFIEKAKKVHRNKYDYSKVEYINNQTKICIICPEHGEFWQEPAEHLRGKGCGLCYGNKKSTTEEFIKKARETHGNKYDYSKVNYANNKTKVCVICPEHGEFWQTPNSHLSGQGCPKCKTKKIWDTRGRFTSENFIKKAKEIHSDKYDYSKANYNSPKEKICIICKKHGEFWQMPYDHLEGHGCYKCKQSHLENEMENFLSDEKIKFESQKRFMWLGRQSLDFYLPDYNVAIECQGEQHFEPLTYFGGIEAYKNRLECDKKKRILCEKNGITLMYFTHYKDINNISDIYCNKESLLRELNNNIN